MGNDWKMNSPVAWAVEKHVQTYFDVGRHAILFSKTLLHHTIVGLILLDITFPKTLLFCLTGHDKRDFGLCPATPTQSSIYWNIENSPEAKCFTPVRCKMIESAQKSTFWITDSRNSSGLWCLTDWFYLKQHSLIIVWGVRGGDREVRICTAFV